MIGTTHRFHGFFLIALSSVMLWGTTGSPGCAKSSTSIPQCRDGKDNDGDGLTDFPQDPDCKDENDDSEARKGNGTCGDGVVDPGEACDDGNQEDGDSCRSDCGQDMTLCGNGQVDLGEVCDDGNRQDGDDCSSDCDQDMTLCGNGQLDPGEFCDDGNRDDGDSCRGDCRQDTTLCGNGILDPGELCDDGKPPGQSICSTDCTRNDGPCRQDSDCLACHVCDDTGHCAPAAAGDDPKDDCPTEPESSCGKDGFCDGAGRCRLYGTDVLCGEGRCEGQVLVLSQYCDGHGNCAEGGQVDCSPGDCKLPDAPESGLSCGEGEPAVLTNDEVSPQQHRFQGNLLHSGGENWYRLGAVATDGAFNLYVWFESNPNDEFLFEVYIGEGNVDDCSDGVLQCQEQDGYDRFSYVFDQCDTGCDELGRNVYIGVRRKPAAVPSCSDYVLVVQMGGQQPW